LKSSAPISEKNTAADMPPAAAAGMIYEVKMSALNKISAVPPCQNAQPIREFTVYSVYA